MNLFSALDQYATPRAPEQVADLDFICTIKTSRAGKQIMLCSIDPAPQAAIDQAIKAGFPLFVASEIAQMIDIDAVTLDSIIVAKTIAPGCRVDQVIKDSAA